MAQHVPIECMPQKAFQKIKTSIENDFKHSAPITSMRYDFDQSISDHHAIDQNDMVFTAERYIGPGFVYGSKRGSFEIHYDKKRKQVTHIYFVA